RLAEAFAAHHSTSRAAGQLYAAWRDASPSVRERILEDPELFLKVQRQHSPDPSAPLITQLLRDLEMVVAIIRRENRRLVGATVALECAQIHGRIAQAQQELHRLAGKIPKIPQEEEHVEPKPTDHDSGIACPRSEQTRDCPGAEDQPAIGTQSAARELSGGTETLASGEGRTLSPADPGTARQLQGKSGAGAGGAGGQRSTSLLFDPDRLLPPAWHRTTAHRAVRKLSFPARRRNSARHLSARARAERQAPQGANGLGGAVLFAHVVLPDVSHLSTFRLQGVSHRSLALLRGRADSRGHRQHSRGGAAWHRAPDGSCSRDGGFRRAFRLPVPGSRARACH